MATLTEQLRQYVEKSGLKRRDIAAKVGLSESLMSRFMSGEAGISLDRLDRLAALLKLRLVCDETAKRKD